MHPDGELVVSPSPRYIHQDAVMEIAMQLRLHARERGDAIVPAPFGIRTGERTVVEVLPPSNRSHDLVRKRRVFEQHGIREAWFVDVDTRRIEQVVLGEDGTFGAPVIHEAGATVTCRAVPGLSVDVNEVLRHDPEEFQER